VKIINGSFRIGIRRTRPRTIEPISYQAVIGRLLSEMADLVRTTDPRKFFPPFQLVIIDNRGGIAFTGQVGRDGRMQPSGPIRKMRRSHFPANALITDGSLVTRTFRIDCASPKRFRR
jgi:hypothetical protein